MDILKDLEAFLTQINWLVSLFLAIILSIIANILTPTIQTWLAHFSGARAQRRIKYLEDELSRVTHYHSSTSAYMLYVIRNFMLSYIIYLMTSGLSNVAFFGLGAIPLYYDPERLTVVTVTNVFMGLISAVAYLISALIGLQTLSMTNKVEHFARYKVNVEHIIESLKAVQSDD